MKDPSPSLAVREQERQRLARLLREHVGQSLNLLAEQANVYRVAAPPSIAYARQAIDGLAHISARALADLYDLMADLDAGDLYDLGLPGALEMLGSRIERRYGLVVTLDLSANISERLAPDLALAAYRIVQEALHNAGQHAGAGRVGLSLRIEQHTLRLTVADDGAGFHPPHPLDALVDEGKRGLAEMIERATSTGGQIEISSVLGVGTQVRAQLPLQAGEERPPADAGEPLLESLTSREQEVLSGVAAGLTNKQIAARLGISDRTVQFHLGNVLSKLGVSSRTEAAVLAVERGLT